MFPQIAIKIDSFMGNLSNILVGSFSERYSQSLGTLAMQEHPKDWARKNL
jgi:hypothetical protein